MPERTMTRTERAVAHVRERLALEPNREGSDIPDGALTRDWVAVRRTQLKVLITAAARQVPSATVRVDRGEHLGDCGTHGFITDGEWRDA